MQFELEQATEVLSQTPAVLNALLRGKSAAWLQARKSAESFSALDVLGHLILADQTDWIPRVELILNSLKPRTFEPFDRFAFQSLLAGKSVEALLDEFSVLRRESLKTLQDYELGDRELELMGVHPEFGAVTLRNLLATWVVHDLGHIAQIVKTMANEYGEAVGPWRGYLTILH
jgi:hypothetical protein